MALFRTANGAYKFYLSGLHPVLQKELRQIIHEQEGETVSDPLDADYVLWDPRDNASKPQVEDGTPVVCFTFIPACIQARELLDTTNLDVYPVFLSGNENAKGYMRGFIPLEFFIHQTIPRGDVRELLKFDIAKYGGVVTRVDSDADLILVGDEPGNDIEQYYRLAKGEVQGISWFRDCIRKKRAKLSSYRVTRVPGRRPGQETRPFTREDMTNLVRYAARMAPKKSSQRRPGSRAGYLLYENLYRNLDIYPWAKNHTVQSWNNHYKKHMEFYDRQIDRYKEKHGISSGDDEFEDLDFHSEGSVSPQRHELPKRRLPRRESPPDIPEGSGNGSRRSRATSEDDSDGEYRPRPKPRKIARTPAIHHISHIAGISGSSAEERSDSAQSLRRPTVRELRPGRNLSAHSADSPRGEVPRSESHSRDADESNSSESGFGRIREGDPENQAEWAKRPRKLQESPDGDGNSAAANESTQEVEEDLRGGEEESSAEVEPPPKNSTNILSSHVTRTRHARRAGLISPPRRVTRSGARVQAGRRVTRQRGR